MRDDLDAVCVVCYRKLGLSPATLGDRTYCEEHIEKVALDRPGVWRASTVQLVVLPVLLVVVLLTQVFGLRPGEELRLPVSMVLAVLPGVSWLSVLYLQEQHEGSVTQFLPTVVVLGALAASAIGLPFIEQVAAVESWLPTGSLTTRFLGNLLLVGSTHMFLIYAVVRFTVLRTPVFERRVDGILFAVATAVGYATMLNVQLVVRHGGIDPASGIFRVIGDVVGHAGAAAVLGFFVGRQRFENFAPWYLPAGLMLAVFVDGAMVYSRAEINRTSLNLGQDAFSPWPGFAFSFFLAIISFAAIYGLTQRHNTLTRARMELHVH